MAETEVVVSEIECEDGREAGAGDAARTGQTKKEPHSQESSLQKENVSDNGKRKIKEEKPPSKVVIRRLPPTMSKEIFTKEIGPIPEHDYFYFVPGDPYAGTNMGFSRAYINFIHQEDIFSFTETYDNYVFVDSKGQEYPAIVEFALFQRIPKQRTKKRDHMCGSVQSDSAYLMFKENLEASATAKPDVTSKQHFFETDVSTSSPQEATTTPLLEFLKQKRVDKARMRDERREEKKRKDTERKLRLKGKEKKPEGEDEPKDIKNIETSAKTFSTCFVTTKRHSNMESSNEEFYIKSYPTKPSSRRSHTSQQPTILSRNDDSVAANLSFPSESTSGNNDCPNLNGKPNYKKRQYHDRFFFSGDKNGKKIVARNSEFKAKQQTAFLRRVLKLSNAGDNASDSSVKWKQKSFQLNRHKDMVEDKMISSISQISKSPLLPTPSFSIGCSHFPDLIPFGAQCSFGSNVQDSPL